MALIALKPKVSKTLESIAERRHRAAESRANPGRSGAGAFRAPPAAMKRLKSKVPF